MRPVAQRAAFEAQIPTEVLRQDQSRSSVHHEDCAGKAALPVPPSRRLGTSAVDVIMSSVRWSMVAGRRLAMNSVHHGWFFDNKEWIVFIILTVVLWLL